MLRWAPHLDGTGGWHDTRVDRVGSPIPYANGNEITSTVVHTQRHHRVECQLYHDGLLDTDGGREGGNLDSGGQCVADPGGRPYVDGDAVDGGGTNASG